MCCSVSKSCPAVCDVMDCSTPGLPVLHYLPELLKLVSTESVIPSKHLILCCPILLPSISPSVRVFSMSWLFASGVQSIGESASASVLLMNIQNWFPLELTGLISLLSKGLSRVFSSTTIWKHLFSNLKAIWKQISLLCLLYGPTLTSLLDYWKNHSFD